MREKTLVETVNDILLGQCQITEIPRISVVRIGDVWVTADNRRLWVFRVLESLGQCDTVTVKVTRYICRKKNMIKNPRRARKSPLGIQSENRCHRLFLI